MRYYKFLLAEYHEEFLGNMRDWLFETFRVETTTRSESLISAARKRSQDMQLLYGADTLPDGLLDVLNTGLDSMCHVRDAGEEDASRSQILGQVLRVLERLCMHTEEKPVVTIFLIFTQCVQGLFRFHLLRLPVDSVIRAGAKEPRPESQKRIRGVCKFLNDPNVGIVLRRACLCTRLTQHAVALTGKARARDQAVARSTASDGEGVSPEATTRSVPPRASTLVRLARGEVGRKASQDLTRTLQLLHVDPHLEDPLVLGGHRRTASTDSGGAHYPFQAIRNLPLQVGRVL